jgi:hypothetical protein
LRKRRYELAFAYLFRQRNNGVTNEEEVWNSGKLSGLVGGSQSQAPGAVLRVHGKCEFPTPGYSVELKRSEPQGTYPKELFLELVIHEPTGPEPRVITEVDADYEEETETEYDAVTIRGYVSVPVEVVH